MDLCATQTCVLFSEALIKLRGQDFGGLPLYNPVLRSNSLFFDGSR